MSFFPTFIQAYVVKIIIKAPIISRKCAIIITFLRPKISPIYPKIKLPAIEPKPILNTIFNK